LIGTGSPVHSREATTMSAKKEKVTVYTCERCGHKWAPRHPILFEPIDAEKFPGSCPSCKQQSWNTPEGTPRKPRPKGTAK
jgi:hypothetical protein